MSVARPRTAQLIEASPFIAEPDYTDLVNPPPPQGDPVAVPGAVRFTSGATIAYSLDRVDATNKPITTLAGDEVVNIELFSQFKVNGQLHVTKRPVFAAGLRREIVVDDASAGRLFWIRVVSLAGTWAEGDRIEIVQLPSA